MPEEKDITLEIPTEEGKSLEVDAVKIGEDICVPSDEVEYMQREGLAKGLSFVNGQWVGKDGLYGWTGKEFVLSKVYRWTDKNGFTIVEAGNYCEKDGVLYDWNDKTKHLEAVKIGNRHSKADSDAIQQIHDQAIFLGAQSPPPPVQSEIISFPLGNYDGKSTTNALKAISQTDDELRVGNYITLWGDEQHRDLEGFGSRNINADGTKGQYFTPNTQFESSYTKSGAIYVDWEHSLDPDDMGIDEDELLGHVDWKTAKIDEKGLFVERVLNRRSKYVQYLEQLIAAGLVGNSTQAIPKGVKIAQNGEITKWPLKRDTLTVQPMEPRMLSENIVTALKALKVIPSDEDAIKQPTLENQAEDVGNTSPVDGGQIIQTFQLRRSLIWN